MILFLTGAGIALLLMIGVLLYRAIGGPTGLDRIVAVNVIGTKTTIVLVIMGMIFERVDMFVDIAIGYALLNFIVSIAASKYIRRHRFQQVEELKDL